MKNLLSLIFVSFMLNGCIHLNAFSQVLHHQMLSSQGSSLKTSNGYIILQSIGQQSAVGNFNKDYLVQQGFQQSLWGKYLVSNSDLKNTVTIYHNPFFSMVNFKFFQQIKDVIQIDVFDLNGKLVYKGTKNNSNELINIDLVHLTLGSYLVRLTSKNFICYNKIIKQ